MKLFCTSLPQKTAFALAIVFAAGCATARNDISSIKNPGASVEHTALPTNIVRTPAKETGPRADEQSRPSSDVILASAEEEPRSSRQVGDRTEDESSTHKLEARLRVPDALPGSHSQQLKLPKSEKSRVAAIQNPVSLGD